MFDGKRCRKSLGLEPSLRAGSLHAYGTICPGPLCLRTNHVRSPWAWRNWLSVGATSSRFAAPPIPPPRLWYHNFRNLSLEGYLVNLSDASIYQENSCTSATSSGWYTLLLDFVTPSSTPRSAEDPSHPLILNTVCSLSQAVIQSYTGTGLTS